MPQSNRQWRSRLVLGSIGEPQASWRDKLWMETMEFDPAVEDSMLKTCPVSLDLKKLVFTTIRFMRMFGIFPEQVSRATWTFSRWSGASGSWLHLARWFTNLCLHPIDCKPSCDFASKISVDTTRCPSYGWAALHSRSPSKSPRTWQICSQISEPQAHKSPGFVRSWSAAVKNKHRNYSTTFGGVMRNDRAELGFIKLKEHDKLGA